MSLDGALLHRIREELSALVGARVEKIYQPSREEIVLTLRQLYGERGARKLLFSANSSAARVNLTSAEYENPKQPPMFCMLLRKHLSGGKLVAVRQDGLERILYFDFECVNEIGDTVQNTLAAEIMGRSANIILLRGERVLDSAKHISDPQRRILPNCVYEPPARPDRLNFLECSAREVIDRLRGENLESARLSKALPEVLEGISPIFARECAFYAANDTDAVCNTLSEEQLARVGKFLEKAKSVVCSAEGGGEFAYFTDETGKKRDFCFVPICQYGESMKKTIFGSANELLDAYFSADGESERRRQRSKELLKTLNTVYERTARKAELRRKELAQCAEREQLKICGDLINANIYRLEKGMNKCVAEDFYTGEEREISLDVRLTPQQNAQKYYSEYKKLDNAEKKLKELIAGGEKELSYLDSVIDCAMRAETDGELSEIKRELSEQGYIKTPRGEKSRGQKLSEPIKYLSSDGYEILVGRNNRQNDLLTFKTARAADIWLHVKDIPGSHVIVRNSSGEVPESTIFEAANIAAYHSKGRTSSGVPVDYTAVKFVKKPAGAKPGMVIFTNNRTVYVTPDESVIEKLRGKG